MKRVFFYKKCVLFAPLMMFASSFMQAKAESYVYIFDNYPYAQMQLAFNGEDLKLAPRPERKKFHDLTEYMLSVTKFVIENDGRLVITRNFTWSDKPYRDEMTLDIVDGESYYLELVAGMKSKLKLLDEKAGEKKLREAQKNSDRWIINEDKVYEN